MVRIWIYIGMGLSLVLLLWWPLDPLLYAERPQMLAAMTWLRAVLLPLQSGMLVIGQRLPWQDRFTGTVVGAIILGELSWICRCLSWSGEPVEIWFPFYIAPLFTIGLLVPLRWRLLWTGLVLLDAWVLSHAQLRYALFPVRIIELEQLSFFLFTTGLSVLIGHIVYLLVRGQFLLRWRLGLREQELSVLLRSTEDRVMQQAVLLLDLNRQAAHTRREERSRIARDLHDGLGQDLTATRLVAGSLLCMPLDDLSRGGLEEVSGLLDRSHRSLRQALHDLHPEELEEHGLIAALRAMAGETARLGGIHCTFYAGDLPDPVPTAAAAALFRICQESLSNILRHSRARSFLLHLHAEADQLHLHIKDDGIGLPPAIKVDGADGSRFGLRGIRERVAALDGEIHMRSDPGLSLSVILPLTTIR